MPTSVGPNTKGEENLVFGYDLGDTVNSYKGEPTENLSATMASAIGGDTSLSYPQTVYISTALETNVIDSSAPGGQYSRFTGNTDNGNNQLYTRFNAAGIDVRNTTITYSVYLKGSGNCHLTIYADNAGYGTSPTITLTDQWTRYSYTSAVTNYTTDCWVAVRGLYTTTNVYVAAQQSELKSHATPYTTGTRSATQGLIDLTGNSTIDLTNVSFDSNAQMTFDGTSDYIDLGDNSLFDFDNGIMTVEAIVTLPSSWTAGSQYPNIISKGASAGWDTDGWALFGFRDWPSSGQKSWGLGIRNGATNRTVYIANRATDKYLHIVATLDGSTMRLYENGVQVNTNTQTINPASNSTSVRIARDPNSNYFPGEVPYTRVYNRALTTSEIKANYNAIKGRFNI